MILAVDDRCLLSPLANIASSAPVVISSGYMNLNTVKFIDKVNALLISVR